jgi:tripartite-type tricarboxylate transporter receptor subunit TctC
MAAAALPVFSALAWAQAYPAQPVRIVVGAPAGSSPDMFARLIGHWLEQRLGQPFVIENRPGAGGNIATEMVVHAPPDGYTLLLVSPPHAINATLYHKLNFNFIRDIAPVAGIVRTVNVMVVNPSFPANSVPDFIAYAKANPGKISMASAGIGSGPHLYGELFKMLAGIEMVHVPYRGGPPAITDLIAGRVDVLFIGSIEVVEHIKTGKLRALAVTTATTASDVLSNLPTVSEFVPGYDSSGWFGIGAPKNVPTEVVDKLNREINAALANPDFKARLADVGPTLSGSPAEFGKLITEETDKWGKVIQTAKIKVE